MPLEDTSHSTCSNDGLWGLLTPLDTRLDQQKFKASNATYTVGRELGNDLQLSGNHISKFHCIICWDGQDSNSKITVIDLSMNGTYINGRLVGKHKRALLQHGDVIVFGIRGALDEEPEHRYTYSHMAGHKCITLQDDYKIIGQVGKGTFATVLKARCLSENRLYAIKVLERDVLDPSKSSQGSYTFEREISIMERLIHPNICGLKEVFYECDRINLVLEFIPGGDLAKYIKDCRPFKESEAQRVTYQICDAVTYIHSMGVVHRDLKPANILMTKGNPPMVKIADFGLSKIANNETMLRTLCGTPWYLAPEVVSEGSNDGYDQAVDSYSTGVIVFQMFTSHLPFVIDRNVDLTTWILTRRARFHILRECMVGRQARAFCRGLLKVDPSERMSISDARRHPWLAGEATLHGIHQY